MKMTQEMKDVTEKLSRVNIDFIKFAEKNPETLNRTSFATLELNDRYYGLQAWPTFINRQRKEEFRNIAVNICELIKSIPARVFNNDPRKISAYFEIPVNLVKIQLEGVNADHLANLVGRGDFIFSSSGLKCLEFNISANVSGWQLPEWESLYLNTPIIAKFLKEKQVKINNDDFMDLFVGHIVNSAAPLASAAKGSENFELNAAIILKDIIETHDGENPLQVYVNRIYKEHLSRRNLKGGAFTCDFPHLEFKNNAVFFKGQRIHTITELYHGVVPPGVVQAFTAGNLRLLNGPVTSLLSNKFCLALLSEYENSEVFSKEEKKTIKEAIPWTRKIIPGETTYRGEKIIMEDFLIHNKDQLVLKPSIGLGGEGVYVGQGTQEVKWEILVQTAIEKRNYLVQELVDAPPSLYQVAEYDCVPHDTVWGIWVFGPHYGGSFVRARPKTGARKVVNAYTGALISIVFEVDE